MYESFFGFRKRPFLTIPTLERYFPSEGLELAFSTVSKALKRGDGPVAIMGPTGCGKSLLCMRIADTYRKSFDVVMLSSARLCTSRALLQSLLFELHMPYRDMSEGELRLSLTERLQPSIENPSDGLVLIVDEAQSLSLKLLEELRSLTNLVRNGMPRVWLILVGSLRLDELLSHPRMESLNQRLAARCYLNPLSAQESVRYVRHKVELAGVSAATIFTEDSIRAIHHATAGIPRLIDQLADHVLELAADADQKPVSVALVDRAWRSLQQLPSSFETSATHSESNIIEFGGLDDEEGEFDAEVPGAIASKTIAAQNTNSTARASGNAAISPATISPATISAASISPASQPPKVISRPNAFETIGSLHSLSYLDEEFGSPVLDGVSETPRTLKLETSEWTLKDEIDWEAAIDLSPPIPLRAMIHENEIPIQVASAEPPRSTVDPFGDGYAEEVALDIRPRSRVVNIFDLASELSNEPTFHRPGFAIPILDFDEEPVLATETTDQEVRSMITGLNYNSSSLTLETPIEWQSSFGPPSYPTPIQNVGIESITSATSATPKTGPTFKMERVGSPKVYRNEPIPAQEEIAQPIPSAPIHLASRNQPGILAFAKLGQGGGTLGDDRDLLVVEESIDESHLHGRGAIPSNDTPSTPASVPHSYVQLFSMLRS